MDIPSVTYCAALIAGTLWFGMGFRYFGFQQRTAAKVLIPTEARQSPLFETTAAGVRFLGGFNAAFMILCIVLLVSFFLKSGFFTAPQERMLLLLVIATAHFSQFAFNLPVLKAGERKDIALWPVRSGPMKFIFVMDIAQTTLCLIAVVAIAL